MQTIGERLEEARKKKGISIREAAEATKIRGDYLQKFESNQFDIGLTEIYTRGFLRTYAAFLKIPTDRIMSDYAAMGRGDIRPRQPSREIYGRMDITVASASEAADRAAPAEEAPPAEATSSRPQPRYPRGTGTSLPSGPDPAIVFKWVKIGGIIAGVILVLLILRALFTGSRSTPTATTSTHAPAAVATAPAEPSVTLVAVNNVQVTISLKNPDGTAGETVFEGTLLRGETRTVPRRGTLLLKATPPEALNLDLNGKRITQVFAPGWNVGQLPAPQQQQP